MNYLANNIKHLRTLKGFTQEQFSTILNVSRSRISSYEENRAIPPIDFLVELSDYFNIPIDAIIKNDLSSATDTGFIEIGNKRILFPISVSSENEDLIDLVPVEASAGYLRGYSMLPVKSGSYIVARFVEDIRNLKSGRTYIVLTLNDGLVYKRVYDKTEEHNMLQLVSDNKKYDPYYVHIDEIIELWEFTCSINTQEYDENELKISSIASMLTQLGIELKELQKTYH